MILYLASQSPARQQLLHEARIPFQLIAHTANEYACDWTLPLPQLLESIVIAKMESIQLPRTEMNCCYVLTVDTLVQDKEGNIQGKPTSMDEARAMIKSKRDGCRVGTVFCLDKKIFNKNQWITDKRTLEYVEAWCHVDMPDEWIDVYLKHEPDYKEVAGALKAAYIGGYGQQFLTSVKGSYGALSLPIYEIREALEKSGFFSENYQS